MERLPIAEPSLGQEELENITLAVKTIGLFEGRVYRTFENDFFKILLHEAWSRDIERHYRSSLGS